jgi:tetratricopeptide (TPR) repeat protein
MHPLKRLTGLFFMVACTSCATVSQQQQLNYEGNKAYLSARYQEALQRYEKTLDAAYKNKDQQYIAIAMYGLGRTNTKLCRLDEAENWLKQSITARDALADTNKAYITQNLSELARLYIAQERYAEANALLDRAVPLLYRLKLDRSDPIELANQLDEYEKSLRKTGRTVEADAIASKSKDLRQNNPGKIALFRPDQVPKNCLATNHQ